jgi:hypothetical protein
MSTPTNPKLKALLDLCVENASEVTLERDIELGGVHDGIITRDETVLDGYVLLWHIEGQAQLTPFLAEDVVALYSEHGEFEL